MGDAMVADALAPHEDFRHEAFFYAGDDQFLDGACSLHRSRGGGAPSPCSWW